jgi:hypothetical protein
MVAADRNSGEKFAQPNGAKITTFGVKILRRYWDIYMRIFVAKGQQNRPIFAI